MENINPGQFLLMFVLFKSAEGGLSYVGEKVVDIIGMPIWDILTDLSNWLPRKSATSKRWKSFSVAFAETIEQYTSIAPNQEMAETICGIFKWQTDLSLLESHRKEIEEIAFQLEQTSVLAKKPNIRVITNLCQLILAKQHKPVLPEPDLYDAIALFIETFQDNLFTKPEYHEIMLDSSRWEQLRTPRYDSTARYIAQVIKHHKDLEFVGIPEIKDHTSIMVTDVFIHLNAESKYQNFDIDIKDYSILTDEYARLDEKLDSDLNALFGYGDVINRRFTTNEALARSNKLVILGDPGAGKTTFLKYIVLAFAENHSHRLGLQEVRLPVFIRLYDFVLKRKERQYNYSLVDYLYTQAHENFLLNLEAGFFEKLLEQGKCCICFDGLDELGEAGLRKEINDVIKSITNRYRGNRFIITSRIVGYESTALDKKDFDHYKILPFENEDIREFVLKWYRKREINPTIAREQAESLIKTILDVPRIKSLATNPLMLTIIALVHRIEAELPHERVKLYEKCVAALTETWERAKRLTASDRDRPYYENRHRLLEQLAYWIHTHAASTSHSLEIAEGDLKAKLVEFLLNDSMVRLTRSQAWTEADAFIDLVRARTGILIERGEGIYAFAHLTFQEYLAALSIVHEHAHSIDELWDTIHPLINKPHWYEVILLLLGSLNNFRKHPTELVRRILDIGYLELTGDALRDRIRVDVDLRGQIVAELLNKAQTDTDSHSVNILSSLFGDKQVVEGLARLLKADFWGQRIDIVRALGELATADLQARSALVEIAGDEEKHTKIRQEAIIRLGKLENIDKFTLANLLYLAISKKMQTGVREVARQSLKEMRFTDEDILAKALDILVEWGSTTAAERRFIYNYLNSLTEHHVN